MTACDQIDRKPEFHRLFLALMPPPDVAARIGEIRDSLGQKGHVADERLHMTMGLLDKMPLLDDRVVAASRRALLSVSGAPVRICLDRLSSSKATSCLIPSEKPPALVELQRRLSHAFADARLPFASYWSFSPHVTLLYNPPELRNEPLFGGVSWCADELALVHSLVGLTKHIVLERVKLRAD